MRYIYLDQNKWIELLKGINSGEDKYIELFNIIMQRVRSCAWAFPISMIHITETMKRKDLLSRKALLDLMFTISGGYSITDYSTANILEFNMWVLQQKVDCNDLRNEIIQRDWVKIVGLSSYDAEVSIGENNNSEKINIIKSIISHHSCDRVIFDEICSLCEYDPEDENFYYESYVSGRESFIKWRDELKKLKEYKEKHVYPAYLITLFFTEYGEQLKKLPLALQEKITELFEQKSKNKTMAIENLEALPGFNIHNRLIFELYNNPHKEVHKHDFNDLAYLRVAIPYCDLVIGENYWSDRVKNHKLDSKYRTVVSTNLFDILSE